MNGALFDRYLKVYTIGAFNVDLSKLHCKIVVHGAQTGTPNVCDLQVYNISYLTTTSIQAGDKLIIDAGYKENHGIIFQGEIVNTRYGKVNGVDTYFNIQCNSIQTEKKIIAKTFPKNQTKDIVMQQVALDAKLLNVKGQTVVPKDRYVRAKTVISTPQEYFNTMSATDNLFFDFNGETFSVYDLNNLVVAETTILSKDTGLIDRPLITQQGIEGKCLINPNVKIGSMVKIMKSSIDDFKFDMSFSGMAKSGAAMQYDPQGLYWIVWLKYTLDNRGKEWYIDFQAVNSTSVKATLGNKQIALGR